MSGNGTEPGLGREGLGRADHRLFHHQEKATLPILRTPEVDSVGPVEYNIKKEESDKVGVHFVHQRRAAWPQLLSFEAVIVIGENVRIDHTYATYSTGRGILVGKGRGILVGKTRAG